MDSFLAGRQDAGGWPGESWYGRKEPESAAELGFQVEAAQSGPGALEPVDTAGWCGTEVSGSQEGRRGAGERRLAPGERAHQSLVAKGRGGHGSVPEGWTNELTKLTGQ